MRVSCNWRPAVHARPAEQPVCVDWAPNWLFTRSSGAGAAASHQSLAGRTAQMPCRPSATSRAHPSLTGHERTGCALVFERLVSERGIGRPLGEAWAKSKQMMVWRVSDCLFVLQ